MKKILFLVSVAVLSLSACAAPAPAPSTPPATSGAQCAYETAGRAVKQVEPPSGENVANTGSIAVNLKLNDTEIPITLDQERTPCTTNSFLSLARQGFFDGTACHRLVDDGGLHVLQCGDPSETGMGGPGYQFADELDGKETYPAGTLAMANAGPDTNGSQFFIVFADSELPPSYTVFGHVAASGLKPITDLAAAGHDNSFGAAGGGRPNSPAVITQVQVK